MIRTDNKQKAIVHIKEDRNLLPSQEYGFRKNCYTIDVLTILENNTTEAFRQDQSATIISLDISKTYDLKLTENLKK
jgi:hypothetical protein